jgi:rhodanese-related sulfurtransferase
MAARRLRSLNPDVRITEYNQRLTADNAIEIISDYDYVLDGTDNFPTRYLVNDACVLAKRVNVYGSILRFEGQVSVLGHENGPCYRCLFPTPPNPGDIPNCAQAGVLGVLPGLIGTAQAAEAIKLILGIGDPLIGRLLLLDALGLNWRSMQVQRHPNCPLCSEDATITQLEEIDFACESDSGPGREILSLTPAEISQRIGQSPGDFILLDVREVFETEISSIPSAVNIPLGQLEGQVKDIQAWHDKTIVVFCQKGMRSLRAIQLLQTKGIDNLLNMHGGIDRWLSDGYASL